MSGFDAVSVQRWILTALIATCGWLFAREISRLSEAIDKLTVVQREHFQTISEVRFEVRELRNMQIAQRELIERLQNTRK